MTAPENAEIVVADDDLMFSSTLSASVARLGYRPVVVRSAAALKAALRHGPRAVIVNLAARGFDAVQAVRAVKEDAAGHGVALVGFCGHLDRERSRAGAAAGCDAVTTNGAITADLARVLDPLLDPARPPDGTG